MRETSKTIIPRDWYKSGSEPKRKTRISILHKIEQMRASKLEDLPQLLSKDDVARVLRCSPKAAANRMRTEIDSFMVGKMRVTTPEFLGEFLRKQIKNG